MYSTASKLITRKLIPFATTWLYGAGFNAMCILEIKHRNRLKWKCLRKTDGKQAQISHLCEN